MTETIPIQRGCTIRANDIHRIRKLGINSIFKEL